jgi:hypothetical protein
MATLQDILSGNFPAAQRYAEGYAQMPSYLQDPYLGLSTSNIGNVTKGLLNPVEKKVAEKGFDLRFDPRVKEQERLKNLTTIVEPTSNRNIPQISLADFEGKPFITSMSDRTAAGGNLVNINGISLNRPVNLGGGQDFMFNNPMVWASGQAPTKQILNQAQTIKQITGQDPLYIPWRMAPTGGDFANMTGETMLNYADVALGKSEKSQMDKAIKNFIPDWKGVSNENAIEQYRNTPDKVRKQVKGLLDTEFRDKGGLSIGEARLSVADQKQLLSPDAGIMNVGKIFADEPMIMNSGHVSYPRGIAGEGIGRLNKEHSIFQLLPQVVEQRGIINPLQPAQTDIRALQMKPYAGILTSDILKSLGY